MKYYIYEHSIDGYVFYIGSNWKTGNENRAYQARYGMRSKGWNEYVRTHGGKEKVEIEIIERFEDRLACLNREYDLIEIYQEKGLAVVNKEGVKGSKNPMYGKRGKDCANYGKVRTEEHKKNYRAAAAKRMCSLKCQNCNEQFKAKGPTTRYCSKCKEIKK